MFSHRNLNKFMKGSFDNVKSPETYLPPHTVDLLVIHCNTKAFLNFFADLGSDSAPISHHRFSDDRLDLFSLQFC